MKSDGKVPATFPPPVAAAPAGLGRSAKMTPSSLIFGDEFVHLRTPVPHLGVNGTQVAACIEPKEDRDATLEHAWSLMRDLARWLLADIDTYPGDERFIVIVGWSRSVRRLQGQIFKAGGLRKDIEDIASSDAFADYERKSGSKALLLNWEKDVFGKKP